MGLALAREVPVLGRVQDESSHLVGPMGVDVVVRDQPLDLRSRQSAHHGAGCRSLRFGAMRTMLGPADEERVRVAGIAAWSLVHGLATLILSSNLP